MHLFLGNLIVSSSGNELSPKWVRHSVAALFHAMVIELNGNQSTATQFAQFVSFIGQKKQVVESRLRIHSRV